MKYRVDLLQKFADERIGKNHMVGFRARLKIVPIETEGEHKVVTDEGLEREFGEDRYAQAIREFRQEYPLLLIEWADAAE